MSEQLKKSTRFLLVEYQKRAGFKKFYRRGGQRFDHGVQHLVDVMQLGEGQAEQILGDNSLSVRQLTEKAAEKYDRLLDEQAEKKQKANDADTEALNEALKKAREQVRSERARAEELERQTQSLLESLDAAETRASDLESRVAELAAMLEADDTLDAEAKG